MQQKIEFFSIIPFFLQYFHHIHIRITRMDRQRHASKPRRADMHPKHRLLHIARRPIIEIIQPRLPNTDHFRMLDQRGDGFRRGNIALRGVMRMDAGGAPDIFQPLRQGPDFHGLFQGGANGHHLPNPQRGGPLQNPRKFVR